MELKKLILIIGMILLISFVYAQPPTQPPTPKLEPGKLWINDVFIPYNAEKKVECKPGQLIGDVNEDGKIESLDASLVLKGVKGLIDFDNIRCADVNCDNQITQEDAQLILQYDAGLISEFPCEEGIPNQKDPSKYSEKEVFLISDKNWKDVLPLVSVTTWTEEDGTIKKYPTLIYHEEENVYYPSEYNFQVNVDASGDITKWINFDKNSVGLNEEFTITVNIIGYSEDAIVHVNSFNINYPSFLTALDPTDIVVNQDLNFKESLIYNIRFKVNSMPASFDADSIIYFMQQYKTGKVTIIGDTSQELDNLLVTAPKLGVGLQQNQIQRIRADDYLSYWKLYKDVVYVEDNYELALLASTYASLINDPLIVQNSALDVDTNFNNKNIICVNTAITNRNCNEKYDLESLQKKYIELTNTDKIILVNPNDLNIKVEDSLIPERSFNSINELYSRTSLTAPLLASGKHEVILSTISNNYENVDSFIENKINNLNLKPNYLTIVASPNAIQMAKWEEEIRLFLSIEQIYGEYSHNGFIDMAVGRIFSLTLSDVSSYLARDLFLDEITQSNNFAILYVLAEFPNMKIEAVANDELITATGLNKQSIYTDNPTTPELNAERDLPNKIIVDYLDHGSTRGWAGIGTYNNGLNGIWLSPGLVKSDACLTCSFDKLIYAGNGFSELFCTNIIRRGALTHIGGTDIVHSSFPRRFFEFLFEGKSVGDSFKETRAPSKPNQEIYEEYMLLGDPLINFEFSYPNIDKTTIIKENLDNNQIKFIIEIPQKDELIEYNYYGNEDLENFYPNPFGKVVSTFIAILETNLKKNYPERINGQIVLLWNSDLENKKVKTIKKIRLIDNNNNVIFDQIPSPEKISYNLNFIEYNENPPCNRENSEFLYLGFKSFFNNKSKESYFILDNGIEWPLSDIRLSPSFKYEIILELEEIS